MKGNLINIANLNFDNERPIYLQLADQIKIEIISGKLSSGDKLPSVRDLAMSTQVNPNTAQKALAELEREELIITERTNGKFVTANDDTIDKVRAKFINEKVDNFLNDMEQIGISRKVLIKHLKERR